MKNRYLNKLLPALLVATLLTGCTNNSAPSQPVSSYGAVTAETASTTGTSTEQSEPENTSPQTSDGVAIEDFTTDLGNGLREITLPTDYSYPLSEVKDGLIISSIYSSTAETVLLTDLSSGEFYSTELPVYDDRITEYFTMLVNGYPVIVDGAEQTMTVYDRTMKPLHTETVDCDIYSCTAIGNTIAIAENSAENRIVFAEISEDGSVSFNEIPITLPEDMVLTDISGLVREGEYLIGCYDRNTYEMGREILNTETSELVHLDTDDSKTVYASDGKLVIREYGSTEVVLFDPAHPNSKRVLETPIGAYAIPLQENADNLYFFSSTEENGSSHLTLYRYDFESCDLTASFETDLSTDYLYISGAYEYNGYVIILATCDDCNRLLVWQPEALPKSSGYDAVSGADYFSLNHKLAQDILKKYSIEVNYSSNGVRHFEDYAVVAETDEKLINTALNTLDGFFGKFPSGFFSELTGKTASYDRIVIYLTGKIIPNLNESQSISDAVAFVTTENDQQLMVLDITLSYALEKNVAHEFMHIIENAMYDLCYNENGEWLDKENFQRWDMFNPDDFSYYYSYTDEYGYTLGSDATEYNGAYYFEGSGTDFNSIYFVDGYSMTYPKEDRARIFENIATCTADRLPEYFKGSAMQLKAAYLCACIRDSFDCITDETTLFWENGINPEYTLEYFRENYDIDAYWLENALG